MLSSSTASRAAYVAAVSNLLAGAAMLVLLRPGLPGPGSTAPERLRFVVENPLLWSGGWLVWHAAALCLLAFYAALAARWFAAAPIRCALALMGATAGLAVDLGAQALYMGVAARLTSESFVILESSIYVLTGYLGNGLYSLAGALLVWAGARELPRWLVLLSLPVWLAGVGLSTASLVHWPVGQTASTAVLMPALVLWTALVGRWLSARAS